MINIKMTKRYCKDFTKIENYEKAIADDTQTWACHHRAETHFSDGTERPKNALITHAELKALELYYDRPAEELIFLTKSEHSSLHNKGKPKSEKMRHKLSKTKKGVKKAPLSEETKHKLSEVLKGRTVSEETRKKLSEANKGKNLGKTPWNKGKPRSEETKQKIRESLLRRMTNVRCEDDQC